MTATSERARRSHAFAVAGWPNALAAVNVLKDIFAERGMGEEHLAEVRPPLLPLADALPDEDIHSALVDCQIGHVAPALKRQTAELLYDEVWRRLDLAPRDRDLATISALMASGQNEFLPFYIVGALKKESRADRSRKSSSISRSTPGWGRAISAAGIVRQLFAPRKIDL